MVDKVKVIAIDDIRLLPDEQGVPILEMFKEICESMQVTIIVTCDVDRRCEYRSDRKKPRFTELNIRASQRYLIDVGLLLYRPEYYGFIEDEEGNSTSGRLEVIIGKNREEEPFDVFVKCMFSTKEVEGE